MTDASLVLGYLNPGNFAGGISLDADAARAAIQCIADGLEIDVVATAAGIHRIINARMNDEVRRVTVQRGYDPRHFTLLPLGGAGPVHGCAIAKGLGIRTVLIPDTPGVLSAFGLLVADVEHDQAETFARRADAVEAGGLEDAFRRLEAIGQKKMAADGIAPDTVEIRRQADMRYFGQSYELTIDIASGISEEIDVAVAAFHARHATLYGHSNAASAVEFVNLRTVHIHRATERPAPSAPHRQRTAQPSGQRPAYFDGRFIATPVYDRRTLGPGHAMDGPAILEQSDTTVILHPGQRACVRSDGSILVDIAHAQ